MPTYDSRVNEAMILRHAAALDVLPGSWEEEFHSLVACFVASPWILPVVTLVQYHAFVVE